MKYFILFSIIILAGTAAAQQRTDSTPPAQGWIRLNTGTTAGFSAIDPHGSDTVYASGDALIRSIDGGTTWQTVRNAPVMAGQLLFVDDTTGFIISGENVYRTTNGGQVWIDSTVGILGPLLFHGRDTGWISGKYVIRTTDNGLSWHQENGVGQNCMAFAPDGKHGYIMGNAQWWHWRTSSTEVSFTAADLERTTDGGVNWTDLYYDSLYLPQVISTQGYSFVPKNIYGLAVISGDTLIAVGASIIAKSTDGGDTWDTASVPHYDYDAVSFPDPFHGTAVGTNGIIMHTSDGGITWISQNSGLTTEELSDVDFVDSLHGYASGSLGVVIKTTDGGLSWVRISLLSNQLQGDSYPNPADGRTTLNYSLPMPQQVNLKLQSVTGASIQIPLAHPFQPQGDQSVSIDTSPLPSGTYTYVLQTEKYFATGKFEVIH